VSDNSQALWGYEIGRVERLSTRGLVLEDPLDVCRYYPGQRLAFGCGSGLRGGTATVVCIDDETGSIGVREPLLCAVPAIAVGDTILDATQQEIDMVISSMSCVVCGNQAHQTFTFEAIPGPVCAPCLGRLRTVEGILAAIAEAEETDRVWP